ncbi:MAG: aminotransferase class I/II-fold pyridoxal phosphate-dependent enzyme [Calditrichaeota bacterium]|nr:aminotransferase class I/II-fold pyridoxal phosphate-dependent enzyme [Calditrichota bacterium]
MKSSISRRKFLERTSFSTAGIVLSLSGAKSLYANLAKKADTPAILGGTPVRTKPFPSWPIYDDKDVEIYLDALRSKVWSEYSYIETESAVKFERKYAELMGTKYCASTNAGTTALSAALCALDVGPGDEVIVPTNTFVATAQVVFNLFALAVFVDSDPDTFMIDADLIEERINERTRAILPVHIGGGAADMDKIMALSKKYNIPVLEDACQAHMGEWRNKKLGSVGHLGCFSFQAHKSLTSGEGGAIIGDDEALMDRCIAYKNNGRDPKNKRVYAGSNYRMTPFQVAVVMGQMRRLEEQTSHREKNAAYLEELFNDIPGIAQCKKYPGQTRRGYYMYGLLYDEEQFNGLPRRKFTQAMRAEGIPIQGGCDTLNKDKFVEVYLNLRPFQKLFSKERLAQYWEENHCPANDVIDAETGLILGQQVFLGTRKDIEDIAEALAKIRKNAAALI